MARRTKEEEEKLRVMEAAAQQKKAEEAAPSTKAFSMRHSAGQFWEFITYELKSGKVIKTETKECMDKLHAIEVFKLAFVREFIEGK
jgi:hypothetical protein